MLRPAHDNTRAQRYSRERADARLLPRVLPLPPYERSQYAGDDHPQCEQNSRPSPPKTEF